MDVLRKYWISWKISEKSYQEQKLNFDNIEGFLQKVNRDLTKFVQYTIKASLDALSNYLSLIKNQILTAELYHPLKYYNEKFYICETCHNHLNKNEIPC